MDYTYLLRNYTLSHTAILVYGVLDALSRASKKRGKNYTYISRESIAKKIARCERTARRAVKELETVGLIIIKRTGRGLNDRIYVQSPNDKGEVKTENKPSDRSEPRSEPAENVRSIINTKGVNNNHSANSIIPELREDYAIQSKSKPKKHYLSKEERQVIKTKYSAYLRNSLKLDAMRQYLFLPQDDEEINAFETTINLMASTMAQKGKISVNGALMEPSEWWNVAKNISQEALRELIYKIPHFKNVRNPNAYLLASIYNDALQDTLRKPYYANT